MNKSFYSKPLWIKLLWIICLWSNILAIYIIGISPSAKYEPSFYSSVNPIAWILLLSSIIVALFTGILNRQPNFTNSIISNTYLLIIFFSFAILILSPQIRGYPFYGKSDITIHIGRVVDIIKNQSIPLYERSSSAIIYPAPILILAGIPIITGLEPLQMNQWISLGLYIFNIVFSYILINLIIVEKSSRRMGYLSSLVLIFSSFNFQVMPTALGFTFLPLFIYFYIRTINKNIWFWRLCLIVIGIILIFVHPFDIILLLGCILLIEIFRILQKWHQTKKIELEILTNTRYNFFGIILLIGIVLITWLSYNSFFWAKTIYQIIAISEGIADGAYIKSINHLKQVNLSAQESIFLFVKMHGHHALLLMLSLAGILVNIPSIIKGKNKELHYLSLFFGALILSFVFILGSVDSISYWRALAPPVIIGPSLISYLFSKYSHKAIWKYSITILIFLSYSLSFFNYHPSLNTYRLNQQVSRAEMEGMKWFISNRQMKIPVDSITIKYIFASLVKGYQEVDRYQEVTFQKWAETLEFPEHFDYTIKRRDGQEFPEYYLPIHISDKYYHTLIPRTQNALTKEDFIKLEEKTYANKIYSNGELDIWYIHK